MLHVAIHWPDMADPSLWPMAAQHAMFLHNHVPSPSTGLCPHDLFFKIRWSQAKFHDLHVWGCPVYMLDKTLSDGKKLPRWMPRSHCDIFMGLSPKHACCSFSLAVDPILSSSFIGKDDDFIGFKSSVNPPTFAKALHFVHQV